jgi:hypothetical protein
MAMARRSVDESTQHSCQYLILFDKTVKVLRVVPIHPPRDRSLDLVRGPSQFDRAWPVRRPQAVAALEVHLRWGVCVVCAHDK